MTETQWAALRMLGEAYQSDTAVKVGSNRRTVHRTPDGDLSMSYAMTGKLVHRGLARFNEPKGGFVLLTDQGKAVLALDQTKDDQELIG